MTTQTENLMPGNTSLRDILRDDTSKFMSVFGKVQSGKTATIIDMCFSCIREDPKLIPLVVLRNSTSDSQQFDTRIRQVRRDRKYKMGEIRISPVNRDVRIRENLVYHAIANHHNLNIFKTRVYDNFTEEQKNKLVIICDEADDILYNNDAFPKQVQDILMEMRSKCFKFVAVTATIDCIIHCESRARMCDVFVLSTPDDYKGHGNIFHNSNAGLTKRNGNIQDNDHVTEVIESIRDRQESHVKFVLVNVESKIQRQQEYVASRTYEDLNVNGKSTVYLSMNSDSYMIHTDFDIDTVFDEDEFFEYRKMVTKIGTENTGTTNVLKIDDKESITCVLNFLETLDCMVDTFTLDTIVVCASFKAGRGLSFVSSSRKIHITDIVTYGKSDLTAAYQSMRIFGRFQDNYNLFFHAPEKAYRDLLTIIVCNNNTYEYFNGYRGAPIELVSYHRELIEYPEKVTVNGVRKSVSEKTFVPKHKGTIKLAKNTRSGHRQGEHKVGPNETLEEAVARVYGPGEKIDLVTGVCKFELELPEKNQRKGKKLIEFRSKVIETATPFMSGYAEYCAKNFGRDVLMRIAYEEKNNSTFYRNPYSRTRHHTNFSYNGHVFVYRVRELNTIQVHDDKIVAWHDHEGNIRFESKEFTIKNAIVSVGNNVAVVD